MFGFKRRREIRQLAVMLCVMRGRQPDDLVVILRADGTDGMSIRALWTTEIPEATRMWHEANSKRGATRDQDH